MSIEQYIVSLIMAKYPDIDLNGRDVVSGINAYIKDNHLETLYDDTEITKKVVSGFLSPIMSGDVESIIIYFSSFEAVKKLKRASNCIFECAINMATNKAFEGVDGLEKEFFDCLYALNSYPKAKSSLEILISDTIMELDYIKGLTDKYSIRMSRKLNG